MALLLRRTYAFFSDRATTTVAFTSTTAEAAATRGTDGRSVSSRGADRAVTCPWLVSFIRIECGKAIVKHQDSA